MKDKSKNLDLFLEAIEENSIQNDDIWEWIEGGKNLILEKLSKKYKISKRRLKTWMKKEYY